MLDSFYVYCIGLVFLGFIVLNLLMNAGPNSTTFLLLAHLYPTSVRATGQGFCFNFGRLIAAIGALQLGNLMLLFNGEKVSAVQSAANAYSVLSCIYLVGMVLVWFAPETKGRSLQ